MALTNAQSLTSHIDSFRETFESSEYHIVAVTESWLNQHIYDSAVALHDYYILRHDRTHSGGGGGVCLYIHNSLKSTMLHTSDNIQYHPEYLLSEIRPTLTSKLLFGVVYRPPRVGFLNEFFDILSTFSDRYTDIIIVGDFNTDMLRDNHESRFLSNHINAQSLFLVPSGPTHHANTAYTLLDLIIADDLNKISNFSQSGTPFLSGHELLSFEFTCDCKSISNSKFSFTYRDFSNFTADNFLITLTSLLDDNYPDVNDCDLRLNNLNDSLLHTFDVLAPLRTYNSKRPPAPWMTPNIKSEICQRERLRARYRRNNSVYNKQLFILQRNKVQKLIFDSRNAHYSSKLSNCKTPAEYWRQLRALSLIKSDTDKKPLPYSANDLNNYFSNVTAHGIPVNDITPILHNTLDPELNRFYFKHITLDMFLKAFYLSKSTSVGHDRISWSILETSLPVTIPLILDILNNSLSNSVFPLDWKKSVVLPLPKTRNPTSLNDFRPISLLPILSKVLERIVHHQMSSYCESNNLQDARQTGYKKGHSTQTALLNVIDDIKRGIDARKITILVLFDFSKAFDLVDHRILLEKMRDLHFSNQVLKWFHSYLAGRQQAVKDPSGALSSWLDILCGVPQGSVLGPSAFTLYLINLAAVLIGMSYILYADDL